MIDLSKWQQQHGITGAAMADLVTIMTAPADVSCDPTSAVSEAAVSQQVRLEAPRQGERIFRNNVGAMEDEHGNFIRFGIGNDTAAINKKIKFPDFIGIRPVIVSPAMVGSRVGIFTGYEIKRPNWVYKGTAHEAAQLAAHQLIISMGGIATFATTPADIWQL